MPPLPVLKVIKPALLIVLIIFSSALFKYKPVEAEIGSEVNVKELAKIIGKVDVLVEIVTFTPDITAANFPDTSNTIRSAIIVKRPEEPAPLLFAEILVCVPVSLNIIKDPSVPRSINKSPVSLLSPVARIENVALTVSVNATPLTDGSNVSETDEPITSPVILMSLTNIRVIAVPGVF